MSNFSLQTLASCRNELLLAEVAALLHDWQKCIDMTVASNWRNNPSIAENKINTWKQRRTAQKPGDFAQELSHLKLTLNNQSIDLKTLCQEGKDPSRAKNHIHFLVQFLGECHGKAHVEKELDENEHRDQACDRISTAFGFESIEPDELLKALLSKVAPLLRNLSLPDDRGKLLSSIREVFSKAWGDTRRPINEVNLWDWGYAVAGLYKSLIAAKLLNLGTSSWRLLRVNFDVLGLYAKAIKIPDLLGYQRAVEEACERVKKLVEEEYPLGNEVYRDIAGIYFTFPDLDLPADLEQEIRRRVEDVEPELAPHIDTAQGRLKDILSKAHREAADDLKHPFKAKNLPPRWQQEWEKIQREPNKKWDVCPVCGLRLQGPSKKALERKVCDICEQRRVNRSETWAKFQMHQTIWTDEVADTNGRLALLVGNFGLEDWLSGDLVQTMLVRVVPNNPNGCVPKNPSPARLRRIWETTRQFWQEVCPTDERISLAESLVGQLIKQAGPRLEIIPQNRGDLNLAPYHTYELVLPKGVRLSLVWDNSNQRFITCGNLEYLSSEQQLGQVVREVLTANAQFALEEPVGYGEANKVWGTITLTQNATQISESEYIPAIPILAEPRTFMALVPADKALELVRSIKAKYKCEMGKVRNRLPLHVGIVYAHRRTPLRAVLEAGRKMLDRHSPIEKWTVQNKADRNPATDNCPITVQLTLTQRDKSIRLKIPIVMGDDETPDVWYPYWCVEGKPTDRNRWFKGPDGEHWVHVTELKENDIVHFTPSTFDFEFLDTTARRFEIHYDANGRRQRRTRPFYLEDLDRLEKLWNYIEFLTASQRRQVIRTIEFTRDMWYEQGKEDQSANDEVFKQFVADTLANALWPSKQPWNKIPEADKNQLIEAAVRGELADLAELHMEIMKE